MKKKSPADFSAQPLLNFIDICLLGSGIENRDGRENCLLQIKKRKSLH